MNGKQAEKKFGRKGTKKARKQWQIALTRSKTPNQGVNTPNISRSCNKPSKADKILAKINKKISKSIQP
jgi:hypothetical protein